MQLARRHCLSRHREISLAAILYCTSHVACHHLPAGGPWACASLNAEPLASLNFEGQGLSCLAFLLSFAETMSLVTPFCKQHS